MNKPEHKSENADYSEVFNSSSNRGKHDAFFAALKLMERYNRRNAWLWYDGKRFQVFDSEPTLVLGAFPVRIDELREWIADLRSCIANQPQSQ